LKIHDDVERKGITFLLGSGCPCRQVRAIQAGTPRVGVLSTRTELLTFWTACADWHATGELKGEGRKKVREDDGAPGLRTRP